MAGQTGNSKVSVLNLKVVKVMLEDNILIVKGSVPGHINSYIIVRK
jgi:large subunit ribosomal protein L3